MAPETITTFDIISFIASIASLILAIGAIWLSVVFYKMSNEASRATTEAAKGIGASVERLEKLFDKLYADTFSMMRDTVSDMRKHIWPTDEPDQEVAVEEAEKKADEKIADLKKAVDSQISELLQRQQHAGDKTEANISALRTDMRRILNRAITDSRQADLEAREETAREHILRTVRIQTRIRGKVTVADVVDKLMPLFPLSRLIAELEKLSAEGLVALSPNVVAPASQVTLVAKTKESSRAGPQNTQGSVD